MQSSSSPLSSPKCSDPWSNSIDLGSSPNHVEDEPFHDNGFAHGDVVVNDDADDVTTELRDNDGDIERELRVNDDNIEREIIDNDDGMERGIMDVSESDGVKEQRDKDDFVHTNLKIDDDPEEEEEEGGGEGEGEGEEGEEEEGEGGGGGEGRFHNANQLMVVPIEAQTSEDTHEEKFPIAEDPLLHVLSDTISGLLMDDAMVTQCGHSFGMNGLQRVKEEKHCLSCGAPVSPDSLIPNYALRAAVSAYKQESFRRNGFSANRESSHVKTPNQAIAKFTADFMRRKSSQFPYVAHDHVLIKGNKRTPERFVGREAIITTQCLNGWYLVRTLDTGESVRLQYRSLQKIGGSETSDGNLRSGNNDQSLADLKEGFKCNQNEITKDSRLQSLGKTNQGKRKGGFLHVPDGQTSCNSSQEELQGEQVKKLLDLCRVQVHDKNIKDTAVMDESADEDMRATKRTATIGSSGDVEGSILQTVAPRKLTDGECCTAELKSLKKVETNAGGNSISRNSHRGRYKGKRARGDPYKKIYMSGYRRRTASGGNASVSLSADMDQHISSPVCENHQDGEMRNTGESNCLHNAAHSLEKLKKDMFDLESEIPWDCMQSNWKTCHEDWCEKLKESSTIQDISKRLNEFRKALLLEKAGAMSDETWAQKLETASLSEGKDAINSLWGRLKADVTKWIESRFRRNMEPTVNVKDAFLDLGKLDKLFPQLHAGGLSHAGIIAAASLVAAEAFANGEVDMEALLGVLMRLIHDHGGQDLLAVRDAVEREKRHIFAKVALLESVNGESGPTNEDIDIDLLIENPKQMPESPRFLAEKNPSLSAVFSNEEKVC